LLAAALRLRYWTTAHLVVAVYVAVRIGVALVHIIIMALVDVGNIQVVYPLGHLWIEVFISGLYVHARIIVFEVGRVGRVEELCSDGRVPVLLRFVRVVATLA